MGTLIEWLLRFLFSPWGLVIVGVLDSTFVFFLPLAIDASIIALSAQHPGLFWLYALLATGGSLLGAAFTYLAGRRLGQQGLDAFASTERIEQIKGRIKKKGAIALALPALIPPPFPFTPFILACGALEVKKESFFTTLAVVRWLRFSAEAGLAALYGKQILDVMESDLFRTGIFFLITLAIVGSSFSIYRVWKRTHAR